MRLSKVSGIFSLTIILLFAASISSAFFDEAFAQNIEKSDFEKIPAFSGKENFKHPKIGSMIFEKINEHSQAALQAKVPFDENIRVVIQSNQINKSFLNELESYGAKIERQNNNRIQASIPYHAIESIANLESVSFIGEAAIAYPDVVSEGAAVIKSDLVNNAGNRGQGVNVAIIDIGFDITNSEIANNIDEAMSFRSDGDITAGGDTAHGTAVADTFLDVAPDARLYLYNIQTEADLLALVNFLITNRDIDVISMSLGFFGVGYSDGSSAISQAVTDARNNGILWANSAGNYAQRHWMGQFSDVSDGDGFHEFFSGDETIELSVGPGPQAVTVFLMWDDPWGSSSNDYDSWLLNKNLKVIGIFGNLQTGIHDPVEAFSLGLTPGTYHIAIDRFSGSSNVELELFSISQNFDEYRVPSSSLSIPADSVDTFSIGATFWEDDQLESFSSRGPNKANVIKPDVSAPDGTSSVTIPNFFGTSASAPHAAGAAALIKNAYPNANPDTVQTMIEQNTASNHPKNNNDGTGRIDVSFLLSPNLLQIKGDPTTSGYTTYQIVVSGQIMLGPNTNPGDILSADGTTINGGVGPRGLDDYTFTGTIVSITAIKPIVSIVNGVEVPNDSTNLLQIKGDPTTSGYTTYQIVVSGQIMLGPNTNPGDILSPDGTTINGGVSPTGVDDYSFTGTIVSITAGEHIFSFVNGIEVPNNSTP